MKLISIIVMLLLSNSCHAQFLRNPSLNQNNAQLYYRMGYHLYPAYSFGYPLGLGSGRYYQAPNYNYYNYNYYNSFNQNSFNYSSQPGAQTRLTVEVINGKVWINGEERTTATASDGKFSVKAEMADGSIANRTVNVRIGEASKLFILRGDKK